MGFGRKALDSVMVQEVDTLIDNFLEAKDNVVKMENNFSASIINVLWQIVASKRFEQDHPDTKALMDIVNSQFKTSNFAFIIRYSVTHILREINFRESRSSKTAILWLEMSDFKNYKKYVKLANYKPQNWPTLISRKI